MTLRILADDALSTTPSGVALRLRLPWIRSLPLASVGGVFARIDGEPVEVRARIGDRLVDPAALGIETGWWFIQDRLHLIAERTLTSGRHDVSVSFTLVIPYLQVGPEGPLTLSFAETRTLEADAAPAEARSRRSTANPATAEPAPWTLAASAFNWTPEVIRAERDARDIAVGIVADRVASVIEIEPGQLWRSYPQHADADVDAFRERLDTVGGRVSIVAASIDDWVGPTRRRTEAERLAFLLPQLRDAHRVGAAGVRLPIGQAGEPLLRQLQPVLHELDLVLFEEIQGPQTPDSVAARGAIEAIARLDDPRVRLLVDISMLMPSLPPSYLDRLRAGGVAETLLHRLTAHWRDPATNAAVIDVLRSGDVPPAVHTMYMNLLVRFGRSDAADLRSILPLVGAFHLKFWDLDDTDGRVSQPIRDLGAELAQTGYAGTLTSEWGGHEWIDADAAGMTRAHLALARTALSAGARVGAGERA